MEILKGRATDLLREILIESRSKSSLPAGSNLTETSNLSGTPGTPITPGKFKGLVDFLLSSKAVTPNMGSNLEELKIVYDTLIKTAPGAAGAPPGTAAGAASGTVGAPGAASGPVGAPPSGTAAAPASGTAGASGAASGTVGAPAGTAAGAATASGPVGAPAGTAAGAAPASGPVGAPGASGTSGAPPKKTAVERAESGSNANSPEKNNSAATTFIGIYKSTLAKIKSEDFIGQQIRINADGNKYRSVMEVFEQAGLMAINDVMKRETKEQLFETYTHLKQLKYEAEGRNDKNATFTLEIRTHAINYIEAFAKVVSQITHIKLN